jgi:hypothetical protein
VCPANWIAGTRVLLANHLYGAAIEAAPVALLVPGWTATKSDHLEGRPPGNQEL